MQQDLQEHQRRAEHIEMLLQRVEELPDAQARATAENLVQVLLDLYGEGLTRIVELTTQATPSGDALLESFMKDELVGSLLLLHGLYPLDIETRVIQALEDVRPYLKSHGGNVQLIKVEAGVAHLSLEGSCNGCAASTVTLKQTIEDAIYKAAPDLDGLQVEGVEEAKPHVGAPVMFMPTRRHKEQTSTKQST